MNLIDQKILGSVMLLLLIALVIIKYLATRSVIDIPQGSRLNRLINSYNLFFLLVVIPLAAILLITGQLETVDPTHFSVRPDWLLSSIEIAGMGLYAWGHLLMAWALIRLGTFYQLGGSTPRPSDGLVVDGPYQYVRHPMYAGVLFISLGLACLVQSMAFFSVFGIYLIFILLLIPREEAGLGQVFGDAYSAYQRKVKSIIPYIY